MILAKIFRTLTLIILLSGFCKVSLAQSNEIKSFSLKEAQDYAALHHVSTKNAKIDIDLAKKKVWETTAIGLPQVNASVQYQDMLDVPVTLLPDFITPAVYAVNENMFGLTPTQELPEAEFFPAKFGTQHNLSYGGTVSQLIFNGQYLVGLQAARTFLDISKQGSEKTEIETRQAVAGTYILVTVLKENKKLLDNMLPVTERMVFEAEESFRNGMIDDITRDQVKLNLTNIKNSLIALERNIEVTERLLKFQMGLDLADHIMLKDSVNGLLTQMNPEPILASALKLENHIDYRMMKTQEKFQWLNMKKEQSSYLPVISGFYTYQERAMRNEFDFLDKNGDWFPTSIIGLQMDIPIFSSFSRQSKVQQARLSLEKTKNLVNQVAQGLQLNAEQCRINFNSALDKFRKESDNYQLADNIYKKTNIKFKEGIASSTEVTLATNQYLTTETGYYNAILELLLAKLNYDKAVNNQ
ncbi:MAG: TolC family protein [Bacteroidales bacterium]